jgi:hypothetical protein
VHRVVPRPVVFVEDALRGTIEIVILAIPQGPQKDRQAGGAEQDRDGNEIEEIVHVSAAIGRSAGAGP